MHLSNAPFTLLVTIGLAMNNQNLKKTKNCPKDSIFKDHERIGKIDGDINELLARAKKGDEPAKEELLVYARQLAKKFAGPRLSAHLRKTVDSSDIAQEVASKISHMDRVKADVAPSFAALIYKIANRIIFNRVRSSRTGKRSDEKEAGVEADPVLGSSIYPDRVASNRETIDLLVKALDELTEMQRTCICLHYLEGLKVKEIAQLHYWKVEEVIKHLAQARKALRRLLESTNG